MAARNPQTQAKRARELALREKRERKREKKAERRAAGGLEVAPELTDDDAQENELSLREGFRVLSAYCTANGQKLWIITEADRSSTTILLPSEY